MARTLPIFGVARFGEAQFGGVLVPVPFMPLWAIILLAGADDKSDSGVGCSTQTGGRFLSGATKVSTRRTSRDCPKPTRADSPTSKAG